MTNVIALKAPKLTDAQMKLIDELGALKAVAAEVKKKADAAKKKLGLREGAYEGYLFRLVVSEFERDTLDMDAVRAKLSPQFIAAHTNTTDVIEYRLYARTGEVLKQAKA